MAKTDPTLHPVTPGDPFKASQWNTLISLLSGGSSGPAGFMGRAGAAFRAMLSERFVHWPAVLVDEGPDAEADHADAHYWVKRVENTKAVSGADAATDYTPITDYREEWVTALNLGGSSHDLAVDGTYFVEVFETEDQQNPSEKRYYFIAGAAGGASVVYGKVKTVTSTTRYVTVNPCSSTGGDVDTGTDVTVFLRWKYSISDTPVNHKLAVNDIIAYLPGDSGVGFILTDWFLPTVTSPTDSSHQYKVVQADADGKLVLDYVRAHS